jgi:hypothetical protein
LVRAEHILRVFENKMRVRILGGKKRQSFGELYTV